MAHILVVEDHSELRTVMAEVLRCAGHEVAVASDGKQALERVVTEARPDLVVTDVFMPKMDGLDLIRALRRRFPSVRIIAMSAGWHVRDLTITEQKEDPLTAARRLGADATLEKPIYAYDLIRTVEEVLALRPTAA